jgi:NADH-quinone oxidoreductase subunit G
MCQRIAEAYGAISPQWCGFNVLQLHAARVGALDLGLLPADPAVDVHTILNACRQRSLKALFLLGVDELDLTGVGETFVIYQGHHGDKGASLADVILPGAAYTEKEGLYMNLEGRLQSTSRACMPPGDAREDWLILTQLAQALGFPLAFETAADVRAHWAARRDLFDLRQPFRREPWHPLTKENKTKGALLAEPFVPAIDNFYMTDVISRHSPTMAACTQAVAQDG